MKKFLTSMGLILTITLAGCSSSEESAESAGGEGEETYTITYGDVAPEETSTHKALSIMQENLEEKSDGRLTMDIFPNGQLGGERELLEGVQTGDVTMSLTSATVGANFVPQLAIMDIPFIYDSKEHGRRVLAVDGPVFNKLSGYYEENGLKLFGFTDQAFRELATNGIPVETVEDVEGLRLRTQENQNHMKAWKLLGANPTPLAFSEVYTGLQQGTIDAHESPYELQVAAKLYEPVDHVINMGGLFQPIQLVMNPEFYNSLPEDLQTLLDEEAVAMVETAKEFFDEANEGYLQTIKDSGVKVTDLPEEEREKFREITSPVIDDIREQAGDEIVDLYLEEVENHRE